MAGWIDAIEAKARIIHQELQSARELARRMGQEPEEITAVDVGQVVESVLIDKDADIDDCDITVEVDEDLGCVKMNNTHVYQLFSNLIGNAIQHNDNGKPLVEVRYLGSDDESCHRYLVKDNGSGVPPGMLDKIFTPFFKWESEGTGVGLATVEKIIRLYNGEISAYNDKGACFEFTIRDARTE